MPLFGKSDTVSENPDVREVEKVVAKEARTDQKNLDHAITDLSHADKSHNKSIKVCLPSPTTALTHTRRHPAPASVFLGCKQGGARTRQGRRQRAQGRKGRQQSRT